MLDALPIISEFLASNKTGLADSNGNRWDWIEIYNPSDETVVLGADGDTDAWELHCGTDSWSFPSGYTIAAHEFKVIYAAGSDPSPTPSDTWADFALSKSGETLQLVAPDGEVTSEFDPYPTQESDISYGVGQELVGDEIVDLDTNYYFSTPTPGSINSEDYWYQVEDTKFSVDRGYYTSSFELTITTATSDATIRYTLDGSEPSENGRVKTVAMLTRSGTTATAYCPSHGLSVGSSVQISGAEQSGYNGIFTVVSVPSTDKFTFTVSSSSLTTPATGVIKAVLYKLRTVSSITLSGTTATVTTSAAHGYSVGNWVQIEGANETEYNGVFKVASVPSTTTFTYTVSGSPTSPATGSIASDLDNTLSVSSITRSGTTATVTTSSSHGYSAGTWVQIAGATQTGYNGVFQIATVPSTTTFTYTVSSTLTTPATGTITVQGGCLTYTGALTISKTSTVRAAAYKKDYASTDVDTQSYFFLADILTQSSTGAAPAGWPTSTTINGQTLNYGMDPDIINSSIWGAQMQAALTSLPTISIVTEVANLLNASSGIYVNATQSGEQWERATSVELIYPDGTEGFQINAGIRIRGGTHGSSSSNAKHAFRLFFKGQYGDSELNYPLFGDDGVDTFDKIDLRCSSNLSWASDGSSNDAMIRDGFFRATQLAMGDAGTRSQWYHLYIDGQYWGLYQTEERPEASYAASYFGGDEEDYDVIKASSSHTIEATDGDLTAWTALWNMAKSGFASNTTYYHAQGLDPTTRLRDTNYPVYLDVDNLIDYMIGILYSGDKDAPISAMLSNNQINNWYGIWNRDGEWGFKFIRHDAELTLSQGETNRNGPYSCGYSSVTYSSPQYLHEELMANAEYRIRFADRVQRFCTHDGVLTASAAISRFQALAEELGYSTTNGGPVVAESARWGDAKTSTPMTKNTWLSAVNNEINNYLPNRTSVLLTQLKSTTLPSWRGGTSAPLYPSVTAPDFNQYGGTITAGFSLTMTGQGTIYYTLDGTDPRLVGGTVSSTALTYKSAITLNTSTRVLARSYSGGVWSALSDVTFSVDLSAAVRVTEIMYNAADATAAEEAAGYTADDFEYIELTNVSSQSVPLAYLALADGVTFTFPTYEPDTSTVFTLDPGEYVLVVANEAAFRSRYPSFSGVIAGEYTGSLNNGGETIELDGPSGAVIQEFSYSDGWYDVTDGDGFSLTVRDSLQALDLWDSSDGWRASAAPGGSPGYADTLATPDSIVINEVLAHSDDLYGDVVELHNTSSEAVDVSGWYLSDDASNLLKYQIADDTVIEAGGYLVLTQSENFGVSSGDSGSSVGFGLSQYGDDLYLSSPAVVDGVAVAGGYREHVNFGATPSGYSVGLYTKSTGATDFTLLAAPTFGSLAGSTYAGAANSDPYPSSLVVSEIMYAPMAVTTDEEAAGYSVADFEYVEIYNGSDTAIALNPNPYLNLDENRYTLTGGIGFTFGWLPGDLLDGEVSSVYSQEVGATATWNATGLGSGYTWDVYATYKLTDSEGNERNLDDVAQYTIHDSGGSTTVTVNQDATYDRQLDADGTLWVYLGSYTFDGTGSVVLTRSNLAGQDDLTLAGNIVLQRTGQTDRVLTTPTVSSPFIESGIMSIPAGAYLVVASNATAFNLRYDNSDGHILVAGTYSGYLDDGGDDVNLGEYELTDADATSGYIPAYKFDHVSYGNSGNWPAISDEDGASIERQDLDEYANDPANWQDSVALGTPGALNGVVDTVAPTVTVNQAATQSDPAGGSTIYFTVVFSEMVYDFTSGDVTIAGTAGATTAAVTGSGTTYSVAVSGMTGAGTVIVSLAAGVAHDPAGNASAASTSTDNTVTLALALAGDANLDGMVNDLDASILAANWQRTGDATWAQGDFNGDGNVNDLDASVLAANWQAGVTTAATAGDEGREASDEQASTSDSQASTSDEDPTTDDDADSTSVAPVLTSGGGLSRRRAALRSRSSGDWAALAPQVALATQLTTSASLATAASSQLVVSSGLATSSDFSVSSELATAHDAVLADDDAEADLLTGPIALAYDLQHAQSVRRTRTLHAQTAAVDLLLASDALA